METQIYLVHRFVAPAYPAEQVYLPGVEAFRTQKDAENSGGGADAAERAQGEAQRLLPL